MDNLYIWVGIAFLCFMYRLYVSPVFNSIIQEARDAAVIDIQNTETQFLEEGKKQVAIKKQLHLSLQELEHWEAHENAHLQKLSHLLSHIRHIPKCTQIDIRHLMADKLFNAIEEHLQRSTRQTSAQEITDVIDSLA